MDDLFEDELHLTVCKSWHAPFTPLGTGNAPPTDAAAEWMQRFMMIGGMSLEFASRLITLHRLYWIGRPFSPESLTRALQILIGKTDAAKMEAAMAGMESEL